MFLHANRGDFSIGELGSIDNNVKFTQAELQAEYDGLLHRLTTATMGTGIPPIMLASLIERQVEARKFLLANGFSLIGEQKINPNTANVVQTFVKKQDPIPVQLIDSTYKSWRISNSKDNPEWAKKIYIAGTNISCSTYCLVNADLLVSSPDAELAMFQYYKPTCAIIITSLSLNNTPAVKVLEGVGFKKVEEFISYYPAPEPRGLFMRYINREDRKKYRCETSFDLENRTE